MIRRFSYELAALLLTACLTASLHASNASVILSEFMASNESAFFDENGESSDWIELRNVSGATVNLQGWGLSDDPENPGKWIFPGVSLGADGYLIVFASGKDRADPDLELHANFRLDAEGESVVLSRPDSTLADEIDYRSVPQQSNASYGLSATGDIGFLETATPGEENGLLIDRVMEKPVFSAPGGYYDQPFQLEIGINDVPGRRIRFTLDGSMPTQDSPEYQSPIFITTTRVVRARFFREGFSPGEPSTAVYLFADDSLDGFSSNLPLVALDNSGGGTVPANGLQGAFMAVFEPGEDGRTRIHQAPSFLHRAGIKIRGSSTQNRPKKAYGVEIWNEENQDEPFEILGLPEESDWILYGPYNFDRALMRNAFVYELSNRIGRYAARTRFVEAFVNEDGGALSQSDYAGVYVFMEKIKVDANRVDIDKMGIHASEEPEVTGGYLFKIDRLDPGDRGFTAGGQDMAYVEPKEGEINRAQRLHLTEYIEAFDGVLDSRGFDDPEDGYSRYIDVPAWIDHHLINEFTKNPDGLRLSTYLHKPRNGKINMGPVWDFDRTMGPDDDDRAANPVGWSGVFNYGWWGRLFQDLDFRQRYIDRWQELRRAEMSVENMHAIIDRMEEELLEAQERNYNRWTGLLGRRNGWQLEIFQLKNWIASRAEWIDSQYVAPPSWETTSPYLNDQFSLRLESQEGEIYYRADGLDPRGRGGDILDGSQLYDASRPLRFGANTELIARTREGNQWSGPLRLILLTENLPGLKLTEIMYHPPAGDAEDARDPEDYEFLEMTNAGGEEVNLVGLTFTQGVEFRFPNIWLSPGEVGVLVKNREAFTHRYPSAGIRILGEYEGNLDNGGETLELSDLDGRVVWRVEYDDDSPWPVEADGGGSSLVLSPEAENASSSDGWRASDAAWGTPGLIPSRAIQFQSVRVLEGKLRVRFIADPNAGYAVYVRSRMDAGEWVRSSIPVATEEDGAFEFIDDMDPSDSRFYRIAPETSSLEP